MTYEPEGFFGSTDADTSFPADLTGSWSQESQSVGGFDGGYYRVEVAAAYLEPESQKKSEGEPLDIDGEKGMTRSQLEDIAISKKLQQMQRSSSKFGSQLVMTEEEEVKMTSPALPRGMANKMRDKEAGADSVLDDAAETVPDSQRTSDRCQPPESDEQSASDILARQSIVPHDPSASGRRKRTGSTLEGSTSKKLRNVRKVSISQVMIDFNLSSEISNVNQDEDEYSEISRTEEATETGDEEDFC